MEDAPRHHLSESERLELEGYLSRRARKKSQAMGETGDGQDSTQLQDEETKSALADDASLDGTDEPQGSPPTRGPSNTRLPSSPRPDSKRADPNPPVPAPVDDSVMAAQDTPDGDDNRAKPDATSPAARRVRDFPSEGPPASWGAEQQRRPSHRRAASLGGTPITPPAAAPHQTLLVTPGAGGQRPGESMPVLIHHPFSSRTPPLVIRTRRQDHELDQGRHLQVTIGPGSVEAQLHAARPSGTRGEEIAAAQRQGLDNRPARGGDVRVLAVDPAFALVCAVMIMLAWVGWWWLLM